MPGSTAQAGCGLMSAKSKQRDLRAVWPFMMSVTREAADVDGFGIYWIPHGKDCLLHCQIEDIHTISQLTNALSANIAVLSLMVVLLLVNTNTMPHDSLS